MTFSDGNANAEPETRTFHPREGTWTGRTIAGGCGKKTMSDEINFDNLDSAGNNDADFPETFDISVEGSELVGRIVDVRENVGKYDKTVFEVEEPDGDVWTLWLNASIQYQVDELGLTKGDIIGVRNTGETYTNDYGTFPAHEVRGKKAGK